MVKDLTELEEISSSYVYVLSLLDKDLEYLNKRSPIFYIGKCNGNKCRLKVHKKWKLKVDEDYDYRPSNWEKPYLYMRGERIGYKIIYTDSIDTLEKKMIHDFADEFGEYPRANSQV